MSALPADLFESYNEALAASRKAQSEADQVEAWIESQPVETPEQVAWAAKAGKFVADQAKQLDAWRKRAKAPWLAASKAIDSEFMPAIKKLRAVKQALAGRIKAIEQAKAEAQAKALMESAPQTPEQIERAVNVLTPPPENTQMRERWTWKVTDGGDPPATLDEAKRRGLQIPDDYWILDTARLDRESRGLKSSLSVPGIEPELDHTVVFR